MLLSTREKKDFLMENKPVKLMIPGPVEVHPDVLMAMGSQVVPHYGAAWVEKYGNVLTALKKIFGTSSDVFLMTGSGTSAIDACLGSSLSTGEKVIIGNNGFFGDRLVSVAEHNGLQVVQVKTDWGKRLQPADFEKAIQSNPDARMIAVVHCETSTTVMNPVEEIGPIARRHGLLFFVDAVSALGGVPYSMDDWCVDLCASASQKCLGAPPGLAPVAVNSRAWDSINRDPNKAHGWYTDLRNWKKYSVEWADWHPTPITMATSIVNALSVSLTQLMEEGISTRMQRFRQFALQLREGLRSFDMPPFTPDEGMSPVLTAGIPPNGVPSPRIVEYLLKEHGIQISAGLGDLHDQIFRIGHMSPILTSADIERVLQALKKFRA
jgi:alanine-glyoxylate transaminase/serine-glyoxylate transaminase/serine-pyruvate transaminase